VRRRRGQVPAPRGAGRSSPAVPASHAPPAQSAVTIAPSACNQPNLRRPTAPPGAPPTSAGVRAVLRCGLPSV